MNIAESPWFHTMSTAVAGGHHAVAWRGILPSIRQRMLNRQAAEVYQSMEQKLTVVAGATRARGRDFLADIYRWCDEGVSLPTPPPSPVVFLDQSGEMWQCSADIWKSYADRAELHVFWRSLLDLTANICAQAGGDRRGTEAKLSDDCAPLLVSPSHSIEAPGPGLPRLQTPC